jgi:2-polyprenyl-3-methyl-5-hydroxy-6-metoxy-1,4-benzoquinol methylase
MKTYSSPRGNERFLSISCPVCGEDRIVSHWECETFTFSRCLGCGHVYQNPQPLFEDLRHRYKDEYFSYELENEEAFFRLMLLGLKDIYFGTWEGDARTGGRFLDIGCATGKLLAHMRERGWEIQGVEICEASARYGIDRRGLPIFIGSIDEAGFSKETFSFIHFSHVIEHVPDPRKFLLKVYDLLAPGGHAVIVTPNRLGLQAGLMGKRWRSCIADHLHLFSVSGLGRLLRDCGFQVQRTQTWGGLAKGLAPDWIKVPLDVSAKRFNFGDVMLFHVNK